MQQYRKDGKHTKAYIDFMRDHYRRYNKSTNKDIFDCYKKPSISKKIAWQRITEIAESKPYITSYNTHRFTACYFVTEDFIEYFIVKTGYNTYSIMADLL